MKKKRLLLATGLGLVSLATTVGELWHKYKDRVIFYDEPNIGLYTGLRIPYPLIVDLNQPEVRWFGGISQKIENTEWQERALFGFGKYGSVFHLIEASDSEGKSFVIDFNPKKKVYLDYLTKEFPKLANYLQEGNFTIARNRVYITQNEKGFNLRFPDNTTEEYDLGTLMKKEIGSKETLMDKIFPDAPFPNLNLGF